MPSPAPSGTGCATLSPRRLSACVANTPVDAPTTAPSSYSPPVSLQPPEEITVRRSTEEQLAELHEAYARTPDPDISQEILELLNFWLIEHILKVDMRYKGFLHQAMA